MKVDQFRHDDIESFLALARQEGWLCSKWEFEFVLNSFSAGCLVARDKGGVANAFVTSVKYNRSGWIGNLLVRPDCRGKGIGTTLMAQAVSELERAGTETLWLTASAAGRPIYEKMGFLAIDEVQRWNGKGKGGGTNPPLTSSFTDITALDQAGWGDNRDLLLMALLERCPAIIEPGGFMFLQYYREGVMLGPWNCEDKEAAASLLDRALCLVDNDMRVFLDVPARNQLAPGMLSGRGFAVVGRTVLMCLGLPLNYRPENIYGFASMGSMG